LVLSLILALVVNSTITSLVDDAGVSGMGIRAILGMWSGAVFGANMSLTMSASGFGSLSGHVTLTLGFVPLGFTVIALAAMILVWRRVTLSYTSVSTIIIDAVRAAIVAAVLMLIVALATTSSVSDSSDFSGGITMKLGTSAVSAFFSTLLVVAVVLILAGLAGRNLFSAKLAPFAQAVGAAVKGLAAFIVVLAVGGLIVGIVAVTINTNNLSSDLPTGGSLTGLMYLVVLAYAGTFGLFSAALGSFGSVQASLNGQAIPDASAGLSDLASANGALWLLVLVPIIALAAGAYLAVRGHFTRNDALKALGAFCVSLLIAVPIIGHFANIRMGFSASGALANQFSSQFGDLFDSLGLPYGMASNSLSMSAGANLVTATFLIFLFGLVVSFLVALASGVVTTSQLSAAGQMVQGRTMQALNVTPAPTVPQAGYGYDQPAGYGYPPPPAPEWTPQQTATEWPQPMMQPAPQPLPQHVAQSVPQPVEQTIRQPFPQPVDQTIHHPFPQPAAQYEIDVIPPSEPNISGMTIIAPSAAPQAATVPPPPPPPSADAVLVCTTCGNSNLTSAKFCDKCGTPLASRAA